MKIMLFICVCLFFHGGLAQDLSSLTVRPTPTNAVVQSAEKIKPISCKIACKHDASPILVLLTLSNCTDQVISVLKWKFSDANDVVGNALHVARSGQDLIFMGVEAKRPPSGPSDFFPINPHEVVTNSIEISQFYDFSPAGKYLIKYLATNPRFADTPPFLMESKTIVFLKK